MALIRQGGVVMLNRVEDSFIDASGFFLDLDTAYADRFRFSKKPVGQFAYRNDISADGLGDVGRNPLVEEVGAAGAQSKPSARKGIKRLRGASLSGKPICRSADADCSALSISAQASGWAAIFNKDGCKPSPRAAASSCIDLRSNMGRIRHPVKPGKQRRVRTDVPAKNEKARRPRTIGSWSAISIPAISVSEWSVFQVAR
jgi:hypothetical protein